MSQTMNGPRWAIVWDDGPPRPQLPVRNLEEELAPCTVGAQQLAEQCKALEEQKRRTDAERCRAMRKERRDAGELRRRPGLTKDTRHE